MNSIGIPTSRTTPKTEVSHGPRTGLRQRSRGNGAPSVPPAPEEELPGESVCARRCPVIPKS
jgi:hypothetical protein